MVALCPLLLWGFRVCPQLRQLSPGSHGLPGPRAHRVILQTRPVNWAPSLSPTPPHASPCGTAFWEIKLPGGLTKKAHASVLGMRPAAAWSLLVRPAGLCPLGRLGPGPGGGLERGPWAKLSASPFCLPTSGWESAGFPQRCACFRTNAPQPPLQFPSCIIKVLSLKMVHVPSSVSI